MTALLKTIPAPVRGWNTVESIANIPNDQAFILDNFIPSTQSSVVLRNGYSLYANVGTNQPVDSLFELKAGIVNKFVAVSNGAFWDITTPTAPVQLASGFSNSQWQGTVFNGTLALVNGVDPPQTYDGTTFTAMTVSGPTSINNLNDVITFKNRTYFVENNSQNFWYSALNTLGGVLTSFPLSKLGNFGGNLVSIEVLTRDGGNGQQDAICFFMANGETIVYEGTDPGSDFSLTGIFRSGRPIGSRSIIKFGADIFFVCNEGYLTMSDLLPLSFGKSDAGVNRYIKGAATAEVSQFSSLFGWQVILSPSNSFLLVNVPQSNNTFIQHVFNLNTLSWSRFINISSRCWVTFGNNLYFGGSLGNIFLYDTTTYKDNGANIISTYQSGSINFTGGICRTTAFRPRINFYNPVNLTIQSSIDFKPLSFPYTINFGTHGAVWGTAENEYEDASPWDTIWSSNNTALNYFNLNSIGYRLSLLLQFSTTDQLELYDTNFLIDKGFRI